MFNILPRDLTGQRVLDLFAGSGSLSLEALSRGAASVLLVDESEEAARLIRQNLKTLEFTDRAWIWMMPISKALRQLENEGKAYDAILLDPPYEDYWVEKALAMISKARILQKEGVAVAEHSVREGVGERCDALVRYDQRRYGDTVLSFFGFDNQG